MMLFSASLVRKSHSQDVVLVSLCAVSLDRESLREIIAIGTSFSEGVFAIAKPRSEENLRNLNIV